MSTKLKEMREQVKAEMNHIPKGDLAQNEFRMMYWGMRMHSLGKYSVKKESKSDVIKKAEEQLKMSFPEYKPMYDKEFFRK
jgi:hypothetical protein